jgi:sugar phosphate isomerase/epimerase
MNMDRRGFIKTSTVTGLAALAPAAAARAATLTEPAEKAVLRLSCQEGVAPGNSLAEKLDFLEEHGFEGLEVGGGNLDRRVDEIKRALSGRKIKMSAICAGFSGVIISDVEAERQKAISSMREILTAAGALGSTGLIIVPAFHNQTKLGHQESRELLVKLLPDLGTFAHQAGTRILLEPLNRRECHFLRQVSDAAAIARDVNNPGIAVMGDFWHMTWEETCDMAAFLSAKDYLHHVHIASRKERKIPGEDAGDNYTRGFTGLKLMGYRDFVSFECGAKGDRKQALANAVKLLREQWAAA